MSRSILIALLMLLAAAPAAVADTRLGKTDPALAARVLALSPDRVRAEDVNDLARIGAPRIFLIQGSVPLVSMRPFAEFLIAMGYPEDRLRDPHDGGYSRSSFGDSETLAGEVAWYYEHDGLMPMLIGHSQGGMLAIRTLYEFAGTFHDAIHVVDPATARTLDRTTLRDPLTGAMRPVVGIKVSYAAALATGKLARVLLGQWSMLPRLRIIPDTVEDFTGFTLPGDIIAGNVFGDEPYRSLGTATVRNVTLPGTYSHIRLPLVRHLAEHAVTRQWIDAYAPDAVSPLPTDPEIDAANLLHAADIWWSVKKHWCIEVQRALRAAQSAP
ncbi:MAG TPA: hypothetical protein VGK44_06025 [Casimicrobiaceae bacterium]